MTGKFQAKLAQKEKAQEMQILENRIKKLHMEEERMQKQIAKAEMHAQKADEIR